MISKKLKISLCSSAAALLLASGCASIIHGSEQKINIISEADTAIYVDGVKYGVETAIAEVKKGESHSIRVEKDGCKPVIIETGKKFDPTTLLGILIDFGIISIPIDLMSGAAWKISPSVYNVKADCRNIKK
jgi:hypothetical protein